jgi:hypothetical protein
MIVFSSISILAAVLLGQSQGNKAKKAAPLPSAVLALTPLNAKTGLWQMTEQITWVGLPPQMAALNNGPAVNYKSCVKSANLSSNPWGEGSADKCHWTVLSSNGTDMEVQGDSCELGKNYGMTANVKGTIHVTDPQDGTGTFDIVMTGNGQTMNGHATYTGTWVSSSCPADVN